MAARYVLSRSGKQYRFVLKAGNNEIILTSERYTARQGALAGIESVRRHSPDEGRYARRNAGNGAPMFNLKAGNGETIGSSELYSSTHARERGIQAVMRYGPAAPVDDQT